MLNQAVDSAFENTIVLLNPQRDFTMQLNDLVTNATPGILQEMD